MKMARRLFDAAVQATVADGTLVPRTSKIQCEVIQGNLPIHCERYEGD
jgi:hypothetical protein